MPSWASVKVLTALVTLPVWTIVVGVELLHGELPSPALMAIPAGVLAAGSGVDLVANLRRKDEDGDR